MRNEEMGWVGRIPLRVQMVLTMGSLTLAVAGLLSLLTHRTASVLIRDSAVRNVGAVAELQRAALVESLADHEEAIRLSLEDAVSICGTTADCLSERLRTLQVRERAAAASLDMQTEDHTAIVAGRAELVELIPTRVQASAAQFVRGRTGRRFFVITEESIWRLSVVYPAERLNVLFRPVSSLGQSGESFLANQRGYFVTNARYASPAGRSRPIDAEPMQRCLSGQDGEMIAPDYRGVSIIHGFRYVPEIGGGCIMAHIDAFEAFAPVRALGNRAIILTTLLALASLPLALLLANRLTHPIVVRDEALRAVAHDLRNPLQTVSLLADLLQKTLPTELTRERDELAILVSSVERADQLIQELLDVARTESGRLPLERSSLDAAELVNNSVEFKQPLAASRSVRLLTHIPPDLPALSGDERRLRRVLSNLIANAIQFSPEGAAVVTSVQVANGYVRFSVADSGPGISRADQRRLFDPFEQAARRRLGGTGLGLAICRGIVEAHGGRIWADSAPGRGSTFSFTLPYERNGAVS